MSEILLIQDACYTAIVPESRQSLEAKLHASPSTCFVACVDSSTVGYLVSVPWTRAIPPGLDAPDCRLPAMPDCLYLHDLAVTPTARGSGAGRALVDVFMQRLHELKLGHASLVAIQASMPYWQAYGFQAIALDSEQQARLSAYGEKIAYMEYSSCPGLP